MSEHAIEWEFDNGGVNARAVCHAAPDADCHLNCPEGCEEWGSFVRRDGDRWHTIPGGVIPIHRMVVVDYCNYCEFLNADPFELPEMYERDRPRFVIAETPIEPVWDGDGYSWRRA